MMERTPGKGFPILTSGVSVSSVAAAVQRVVGAPALFYTAGGREKNKATESEVEEWLSRWKRGEERRVLITDDHISRGWEASCLIAIGTEPFIENLVMRTCGFCILIKPE